MSRASSSASSRAAPGRIRAQASRKSGFGSTLFGLFVGLALGLALAAAVAFYVMKAGNPYQAAATPAARDAAKDAGKSGRIDNAGVPDKPRFDFYKILPGAEEPKVQGKAPERPVGDKATVERAAAPERSVAKVDERPAAPDKADKPAEPAPRAPKSTERIWLQAGSFSTEGDAENLRAQLALSGIEATLQQATVPDKGVRYRVRVGPYDNVDAAARVKADLARRGFDATVIK